MHEVNNFKTIQFGPLPGSGFYFISVFQLKVLQMSFGGSN
jgi:hypothetical protein